MTRHPQLSHTLKLTLNYDMARRVLFSDNNVVGI